jgi:hypothetical protein
MVARETAMSLSANRSITRSNQPKSNSPGRDSTWAQEKMPRVTMVTPASRMSAMSSSHTDSGHCSGL